MTTVFINGRFLTQRVTGVQRYARETLAALDTLLATDSVSPPFELVVLAPRGTASPPLQRIGFECVGPLTGHAWEQLTLARASRAGLLLSFGPTGPLLKKRQVVTIHDASVHAVPQAFSRAFRAWYKLSLPILAQRSRSVMTVSQFSRSEVVRWFGARAEAVHVSGEGWQHVLRVPAEPDILEAHGLRAREYVLAVSSVAPHKNFEVIAQALPFLADCDVHVAVVGALGGRVFGRQRSSRSQRLQWLGYVDDAALRALYENAAAFVHPSRYEGFGIPPLEAMALGCPVIASNAASIPEVCGPAALYFEPDDAEGLAAQIRRVLTVPGERERLHALGRTQLLVHSWEASARAFLSMLAATN
jgi:glycosyltransferase involved in cell wall biosynthesis